MRMLMIKSKSKRKKIQQFDTKDYTEIREKKNVEDLRIKNFLKTTKKTATLDAFKPEYEGK